MLFLLSNKLSSFHVTSFFLDLSTTGCQKTVERGLLPRLGQDTRQVNRSIHIQGMKKCMDKKASH